MTQRDARRARVVVIDDHLLVAHVVVIALAQHGFDASSVDLEEGDDDALSTLLPKILRDPPDVMLIDLDLGSHGNANRFVEFAVRAGVEVVVMTTDPEHEDVVRALERGARCALPKTSPLADLIDALDSLLPGGPLLPAPA